MNPKDCTSCLRTLKLTDTLEAGQDAQRLHRMEERQSHTTMNAERESERSLRKPCGKSNAYKDRIAETERVKRGKELERGVAGVLVIPGNRADEQVAVRHADASGGDIRENQHEEDRMRDIHIGKRR